LAPPVEERWLDGSSVVVTAGGTREPIDPVRYIGNRSSGKMGNELAAAAARVGARTVLITAAEAPPELPRVDVIRVETADEMNKAVRAALLGARILIMAAAVADWRPAGVASHKLKKRPGTWTLELVPTVDILTALRDGEGRSGVFVVGFAAESEDALANAQIKLREKALDLIVVNDISRSDIGMGSDDNEVTIIDAEGVVETIARAPKSTVATAILRVVRSRLR
jgi:phosphopantothenoylcysteine decarboxylase/phosphopantothenate--cysteine ligase